MAKKNSSKTATKEALQASEPRIQAITGWKGIDLSEAPANWDHGSNANAQTDMMPNFLLVQNNVDPTDTGTLETRPKDSVLFDASGHGFELTGVSYIKGRWLYLVARNSDGRQGVIAHDVSSGDRRSYVQIPLVYKTKSGGSVSTSRVSWISGKLTCIYSYLNDQREHLIVLGKMSGSLECSTFTGPIDGIASGGVTNAVQVDAPTAKPIPILVNVKGDAYGEFWKTILGYGSGAIDSGSNWRDVSPYRGYKLGGSVARNDLEHGPVPAATIIQDGKFYIDEVGNMYLDNGKAGEIVKFLYSETLGDARAYYSAYWSRMLSEGVIFSRAWKIHHYNDTSIVPPAVEANKLVVDSTDSNLYIPTKGKWLGGNPAFIGINGDIDPENETQLNEAYNRLMSGIGYDCVRYFITDDGDMWLAVRRTRGQTGYDVAMYQADAPSLIEEGDAESAVTVITVMYAYANKFGQTTLSSGSALLQIAPTVGPVDWSPSKYVSLGFHGVPRDQEIEKINIYFTMDESESPAYMGSIDVSDGRDYYVYDWYGSSSETDEWSKANMRPDSENTTKGPDAEYCRMHDGRIYFWGSESRPYRLLIGGNPGHELNLARGNGGAFIDIEPGLGTVVHGTYKWKTQSGASIVTVLCGNENTSTHKRFNLVENNITLDNELSEKSYMVEEISNAIGCQSNWGAGVWADGLYVLSRYGLTVTTMAMEYNSQIQSQLVSDPVQPVFTDRLATMMDNARMVQADNVVYIVFGTEDGAESLDRLLLCYDIGLKAWYTYTYGGASTDVRHVMNIDYKGAWEGIGLVCPDHVAVIPTTGSQEIVEANMVPFLLETGELSSRRPAQDTNYVAQLEFRFDYFLGDMDIDLEGVDYYGRRIHVHRHVHTDEAVNDLTDWMRVNALLENYHLVFSGTAKFRLTHFIAKVYQTSNKIGLVRGYDSLESYRNRHGGTTNVHHYIRNYTNLRETVLP